MSKWFVGRLENNEFILCYNGKFIRAELDYLPRLSRGGTMILKSRNPLSDEQYRALKEAWDKFKINDKTILLEGDWEIKIESSNCDTLGEYI